MIAKYRKEGHPGEWYLTDFTMEQVEGRILNLEAEIDVLGKEYRILLDLAARMLPYVRHADHNENDPNCKECKILSEAHILRIPMLTKE